MQVHNNGHIAAALILAGVVLPPLFNVEEGAVLREEEKFRALHPGIDKEAHNLLAIVEVSKTVQVDLADKKNAADEAFSKLVAEAKQAQLDAEREESEAADAESKAVKERAEAEAARQIAADKASAVAKAEADKKAEEEAAGAGDQKQDEPDPNAAPSSQASVKSPESGQ